VTSPHLHQLTSPHLRLVTPSQMLRTLRAHETREADSSTGVRPQNLREPSRPDRSSRSIGNVCAGIRSRVRVRSRAHERRRAEDVRGRAGTLDRDGGASVDESRSADVLRIRIRVPIQGASHPSNASSPDDLPSLHLRQPREPPRDSFLFPGTSPVALHRVHHPARFLNREPRLRAVVVQHVERVRFRGIVEHDDGVDVSLLALVRYARDSKSSAEPRMHGRARQRARVPGSGRPRSPVGRNAAVDAMRSVSAPASAVAPAAAAAAAATAPRARHPPETTTRVDSGNAAARADGVNPRETKGFFAHTFVET
jgi:hypothetical protein